MKDMTPERLRCGPRNCPCVHELADGRLLIVGKSALGKEPVTVADDEEAVIVSRDLLEDVFKAWLAERSATIAEAWK